MAAYKTRTILDCVHADRLNLSTMIGHRGDKKLVFDSIKNRLSFARAVIEFYAGLINSAYRVDDVELIVRELNLMASTATNQYYRYAREYPAEFSGFAFQLPNLQIVNAKIAVKKTAKHTKSSDNAGQTALPFDNANNLEKRLDRLESILARLDKHLIPTEENDHV